MKTTSKSPLLYCEFTRQWLKIYREPAGAEFALERTATGRLTDTCRETLVSAIQQFLKAGGLPPRAQALCAIDARGVSLRCLLLPAVSVENLPSLVRMQIESEFPLSPDELAWGFQPWGAPQRQPDGTLKQSVLVAAVKKEVVGHYAEILAAAGVSSRFTISALARVVLCPHPPVAYAVLELSAGQSELVWFEGEAKAFVRSLPSAGATDEVALDILAGAIRSHLKAAKLYAFGDAETVRQLARRLMNELAVEQLKTPSGSGCSAAILGLKKFSEEQGGVPLELQFQPILALKKFARPALVEWGARAIFLALAVLFFPSLEAMLCTTPLAEKTDAFKTQAQAMETTVDRDLDFLQYLKQNQPPYLESFYVMAKAAPSGIHIESLTLNRRGEMALRGSLRSGDDVADFRSKLIASGFFASVTVEEQSPTPDRQKVNIRLTAQWKPIVQLKTLAIGPTAAELSAATNNAEKRGRNLP